MAIAAALLSVSPAPGDEPAEPLYVLDVQSEPLLELTIVFSRVTGENFVLLDQELADKRVSIYAPNPMTADEACQLFVAALRLHGFSVERADAYWKIEAFSPASPSSIRNGRDTP